MTHIMKICTRCGKEYPVTEYTLLKGQYRAGVCRICVNKRNVENRLAKKAKMRVKYTPRPVFEYNPWEALGTEYSPKWK